MTRADMADYFARLRAAPPPAPAPAQLAPPSARRRPVLHKS